jgi:hypothetical protein
VAAVVATDGPPVVLLVLVTLVTLVSPFEDTALMPGPVLTFLIVLWPPA